MRQKSRLRAGVIAAGIGQRLQALGGPKPLVPVGGRALIEHVLHRIAETGASEVVVIINEQSQAIRDHVTAQQWPFELGWIVQTTPSSMHSFLLVLEALSAAHTDPVLMSTVDTVAKPGTFSQFLRAAQQSDADVTLALTTLIADEKPLLVRLADQDRINLHVRPGPPHRIVAIGAAAAGARFATAGYYYVSPRVLDEADEARRGGVSALRAFLSRLVHGGYRVEGVLMPDSIDVDRPDDVVVAERFLR